MGRFFVITGPSASGKTVLAGELLRRLPGAVRLVTTTTRAPRPGEKDGVDYYFISRPSFEEGIRGGDFFEHAEVYGQLYGASRTVLRDLLERFSLVIAVVDVQGARVYKREIPLAVTVFIRPGSVSELEGRLRRERPGASTEDVRIRLATASEEIASAGAFDHIVENPEGSFASALAHMLTLLQLPAVARA